MKSGSRCMFEASPRQPAATRLPEGHMRSFRIANFSAARLASSSTRNGPGMGRSLVLLDHAAAKQVRQAHAAARGADLAPIVRRDAGGRRHEPQRSRQGADRAWHPRGSWRLDVVCLTGLAAAFGECVKWCRGADSRVTARHRASPSDRSNNSSHPNRPISKPDREIRVFCGIAC